jgi:hypothetical protein
MHEPPPYAQGGTAAASTRAGRQNSSGELIAWAAMTSGAGSSVFWHWPDVHKGVRWGHAEWRRGARGSDETTVAPEDAGGVELVGRPA